MRLVSLAGLVTVVTDMVLSLMLLPTGLAALGLLLLAIGHRRARGPIDRIDQAVGAVGIALLLVSAMQPMYWLMPSLELLAGCLLACLSRLWQGTELKVCLLLVPGVVVAATTVGALLWVAGAVPGPHGPVVLVFWVASLWGPISAVSLSVSWWRRRRRGSRRDAVLAPTPA